VNQREGCFAEQSRVTTACDFSLPFSVTIRSAVFPQMFCTRMRNVCTNPDTWQQLSLDGAGLPEHHCV